MAAIELPTCPMPIEAMPFLRDFGGELVPFLGGPEQRINRLGTRWGVRYTMPEMEGEEARQFIARLSRGKVSRVVMPWPRSDFDPGEPGTITVRVAATGGSVILLQGFPNGYTAREGQFLSIIHEDRRYVYMVTADIPVGFDGRANLPIFPALRTSIDVDDVVEVAAPMIEGHVMPGDEWSWSLDLIGEAGLAFTIAEAR